MSELPNIVLVHGAWADGSSWSAVIERLQAEGYSVTAPQFPETSLADDVARLRQVLNRQSGPTIVAGHSYGGQIMTALGADAPNVVAPGLHRRLRPGRGRIARRAAGRRAADPGAGASDRRRAGVRLDARGGLRRALRLRRRSRQGPGDVRRPARPVDEHVRGRDGRAGVEVAPDLVPRRDRRPGDPAGRRADVRAADGRHHGRGGLEPCRDGLSPRRGGRADRRRRAGRSEPDRRATASPASDRGRPPCR